MKILVTGGAGFIGSHVVDAYINEGHEVLVMDDLSSGKTENINPKARFFKADIRSAEAREIISRERPDAINHHAAQISVPASVKDPLLDADINIKGFLNVLEAAKNSGVKKVIFISSGGAVYGEAKECPSTECCEPSPLSPYAVTKFAGEKYLAFYCNQYGLDYTVLRYGNVYGPRQIPHGEAGVVAIFMERLVSGKPCVVYGFPDEPAGMTRDYCYVKNVATANVLALGKGSCEIFNIGTGVETHTMELFNTVYSSLRREVELPAALEKPSAGPARPGDLRRSCLDAKKAEKILGWKAETGLKDGIDATVPALMRLKGLKGEL
ncbi:MAG: NAD-dependent epimerase/dehydratase family protein [Thermodesulfobacteriota bacterium]